MKENYFLTFLKGIIMGAADVVPGVSGGTMALITGIYDRLIFGIKDVGSFLVNAPKFLKKKKLYSNLIKLDFALFIPLLFGIALSFIVGSQLILKLMDNYPAQIYSFFIGLIIASAIIIFKKIKIHAFSEILFGISGFGLGIIISLIPTSNVAINPSLIFIFFLGMIAICAMVLPGISGAYIVLMFGQLKFLYAAIGNIFEFWPFVLVFGIGAVIGLLLFSRLLSFLLKEHNSKTLYALTGIMLGALINPIKIVDSSIAAPSSIISSAIVLIFGVILVLFVNKLSNR